MQTVTFHLGFSGVIRSLKIPENSVVRSAVRPSLESAKGRELPLAPGRKAEAQRRRDYLPREAAGGGPSAERSEGPMVEGASRRRARSTAIGASAWMSTPSVTPLRSRARLVIRVPPCLWLAPSTPAFGGRSPSRCFAGEVEALGAPFPLPPDPRRQDD